MSKEETTRPSHFIKQIVEEDLKNGKNEGRVHTRFPPEPNGYLHIGHAKAICLNFGLAAEYGGKTNLRMDDTNPEKEEDEYVKAIVEDVKWLGFDWEDRLYYASDYYGQLYDWAVKLVKKGKAYVCDLTAEQIREYRGTLTAPGKDSPFRNRSVEENLDLLERMRKGEFPDGSKTLRAKIDMASGNINMRDPVLYRILRSTHHRTGDTWCIYPMYDYAHGQSDSIEKVTHSICTLEFEDHRPLYNWFLDELDIYHPQQIEFARLNLTYTVMSKRKLLQLVKENLVSGWDDPRMPTICGMRRLGYTPEAIREFCERIGVAKANSTVDIALLEHCVREHLNLITHRVMAVLKPLKLVITNYPEGKVEQLDAINNPENEADGSRTVPFCRELYIEQDDFLELPPPKYHRLAIGQEVRLKHAYVIKCEEATKDDRGNIIELRCTYDPGSRSGDTINRDERVKGTIHWVSATHSLNAEIRLYDRLFKTEDPEDVPAGEEWKNGINPDSLQVITDCLIEPSLANSKAGERFQFLRHGYFILDPDSNPERLVFNRTVGLKDTWAKIDKRAGASRERAIELAETMRQVVNQTSLTRNLTASYFSRLRDMVSDVTQFASVAREINKLKPISDFTRTQNYLAFQEMSSFSRSITSQLSEIKMQISETQVIQESQLTAITQNIMPIDILPFHSSTSLLLSALGMSDAISAFRSYHEQYRSFVNSTLSLMKNHVDVNLLMASRMSIDLASRQVAEKYSTLSTWNLVDVPRSDRRSHPLRIQNHFEIQKREIEAEISEKGSREDLEKRIVQLSAVQITSLSRELCLLMMDINQNAKLKQSPVIFKLTERFVKSAIELDTIIAENEVTFGAFIDRLYFMLYEGAGGDKLRYFQLLNDSELEPIWHLKQFRNFAMRHDPDHGQQTDVERKYHKLRELYATYLGRQATPQGSEYETLQVKFLKACVMMLKQFNDKLRN